MVLCTQGWVLMNFEKNIQNNNWDIWNHHYHKKTVEIVEGSHTPVIGSNFASHSASCFEDSKYQGEKCERTQQNPVIESPQILPLAVAWCASNAICTMYFLVEFLGLFKMLLCFPELLNMVKLHKFDQTEKERRIVTHRWGESRL